MPQHHNIQSPMAHQKQPEGQTENVYDEAAFERAFDRAREEMQQSEDSSQRNETQMDAGLHDTRSQESQGMLDHRRIGSDQILEELKKLREAGNEADDAEVLARTAGQLLENVKGDQSQKFKESNFMSLMRQLRDKEVRVEGDQFVDVSITSSTPKMGHRSLHGRTARCIMQLGLVTSLMGPSHRSLCILVAADTLRTMPTQIPRVKKKHMSLQRPLMRSSRPMISFHRTL